MAPRALWKGFLKIDELVCPVALHAAASTAERVSFHIINRKTGDRVRREMVDEETGKPVPREDQVKGYRTEENRYILLDPEEVASAVPKSDKTLDVSGFLACDEIETEYFDKPYYLTPADSGARAAYALIHAGLVRESAAAIADAVLFRKERALLIRAHDGGLVAHTLKFDYEVRSASDAFDGIGDYDIGGEMLDLAKHIIDTKRGDFQPEEFEDHYDAALAELVQAKIAGRALPKPKPRKEEKVVNLMEALRLSAGGKPGPKASARKAAKKPSQKKSA